MKINGSHTFNAPRSAVWPIILDPEVLAKIMPGCEKLEQIEENKYKGVLKIRVGPVQGKFNGTVTLTDINEPNGYSIQVDGKGPAGIINGNGSLTLTEQDQTTLMDYDGDAQVRGRIAQVGQRLLDTSARAIIRQSLDGLDKQVQAQTAPPQDNGTTPTADTTKQPASHSDTVAAPTQTEFALGVAKNFIDELIPDEERDQFIQRAAILLAAILLLNWWTNILARRIAKRINKKR